MGAWHRLSALVVALAALACRPGEPLPMQPVDSPDTDRARMVKEQLQAREITDPRVLDVMGRVPRHLFVPREHRAAAYGDHPLPIGHGQTISQPFIVAFMTQALKIEPHHKVLEIGTGSGYQAAVLAELAREVYTIEIVPELAARAEQTLAALDYRNVHVRHGDGYQGWPEHAPFSKIILTAAPEAIPEALVDQLAVGGRMVLPVGPHFGDQELRILRKTPAGIEVERSLPVRFVPMVKPPA